jgi:hypothetical protein
MREWWTRATQRFPPLRHMSVEVGVDTGHRGARPRRDRGKVRAVTSTAEGLRLLRGRARHYGLRDLATLMQALIRRSQCSAASSRERVGQPDQINWVRRRTASQAAIMTVTTGFLSARLGPAAVSRRWLHDRIHAQRCGAVLVQIASSRRGVSCRFPSLASGHHPKERQETAMALCRRHGRADSSSWLAD